MKPRRTKADRAQKEGKKVLATRQRRFRIDELEERIAPACRVDVFRTPSGNLHFLSCHPGK